MSQYSYEVQETRNVFGGRVPDEAWERVSRHCSARAAGRALLRHEGSMHHACGPNAWTHHHRVVRLRDGLDVTYLIDMAHDMCEPDWGLVERATEKVG